jgi:hypothetical protein
VCRESVRGTHTFFLIARYKRDHRTDEDAETERREGGREGERERGREGERLRLRLKHYIRIKILGMPNLTICPLKKN